MRKILSTAMTMMVLTAGISLSACGNSHKKETVLIYSASEDEVNADLSNALKAQFPNYDVVIQYLGTGGIYSKLSAEGSSTDADIIFDLDGCYAQTLVNEQPEIFTDLSAYDFSCFNDDVISYTSNHKRFVPECKTDVVVAYSKKVLAAHGLEVPTTYAELTDAKYRDLVSISNPKASGTGYTFYNTLVSNDGLESTVNYFKALQPNLHEITSSGSAPLKSVNRGETGIGFVMLWQAVMYANENPDIGITFLDKPTGYNVYTFECINGKEKRTAVKDVFDYMFNVWNKQHCQKFYPDAIYKDQGPAGIPNYPTDVPETSMVGLYDAAHKQSLLDAWPL